MVQKPNIGPLAINLEACTWRFFQNQVIVHICGNKEHMAKFLDEVNALGKITWYSLVYGHATYGVSHLFQVKNASDFSEITKASAAAPNKKVGFKITMVNPCEDQKYSAKEAQIDTALMMKYGPPEQHAILEREQCCLAANPKADIDPINPVVAKIRLKCVAHTAGGKEAQALVFTCPEDPTRTMLLPFKQLWAWAQAIVNNKPGVDYDHPPKSELFVWQLIKKSVPVGPSGRLDKRGPNESLAVKPPKRVASFGSSISSNSILVGISQSPSAQLNGDADDEIEVLPNVASPRPCTSYPNAHPDTPLPLTIGGSEYFPSGLSAIQPSPIWSHYSAFPSIPAPLVPESPAMENISLETFLSEANIPDDNHMTRLCLELHRIHNWTYFRASSELQLIQLGFTSGVTRSLCEGVPRLFQRYREISPSPKSQEDHLQSN
ncbi:hypothetical protein PTTG_28919 [Puccinia triticina 1-1 BBBD Race 1]|uniref:Uncharacterized protein n=1 Tax=Puccinia triticina (isolate 1-1 / race 1 (BBBD)) TaxID=630390 RepID=A0A180GA40_PUCT1|nr:hypothetical protein PTTG_28919 [Puccinia triticina 1-1 BBBD Race 1]